LYASIMSYSKERGIGAVLLQGRQHDGVWLLPCRRFHTDWLLPFIGCCPTAACILVQRVQQDHLKCTKVPFTHARYTIGHAVVLGRARRRKMRRGDVAALPLCTARDAHQTGLCSDGQTVRYYKCGTDRCIFEFWQPWFII